MQTTVSGKITVSSPTAYNQTEHWKKLRERAAEVRGRIPTNQELIVPISRPAMTPLPVSSIVHLILDREVVPRGALQQAIVSDGRLGPHGDLEKLSKLGYVIRDGKVSTVDDMPIGQAYLVLQYWGGQKQHKRWHLAAPIEVNPSRNGDPCFMDEDMIAFRATWGDMERFESAFDNLVMLLQQGLDNQPAGNPLVLDVVWT